MKYLKSTLLSILLLLAAPVGAVPTLEMQIYDLNTLDIELFDDTLTPGSISVSTAQSAILAKYWRTASIQTAASNNRQSSDPASFISSSINLDAIQTGKNVIVAIEAVEFTNPSNGSYPFGTTVNAATVTGTEFDVDVFVDGLLLLAETGIDHTDTMEEMGNFTIGTQFDMVHVFDLVANQIDGDLGFDISTRAFPASSPMTVGLIGLGLMVLGAGVKRSRQ